MATISQSTSNLTQQSTQVNTELENKLKEIEQTLGELKRALKNKPYHSTPRNFQFSCWECKQVGHKRAQCPTLVHAPQHIPGMQVSTYTGNDSGLSKGPLPSPQ